MMERQRAYCKYPPQIAIDFEVSDRSHSETPEWIAGSASAGRFVILREPEFNVLTLIDGARSLVTVCDEFQRQFGATLPLKSLTRFLAKLDQIGILAGRRPDADDYGQNEHQLGAYFYKRFKLFNPERLFVFVLPHLRWIWTPEFFGASILFLLATSLLALIRQDEIVSYAAYILREHYLAVFLAGLVVVVTHEFAHGMTCVAFGGRVTEVGVLMIYYFIPGLYCNVSGIHLIPKRRHRLWVIAAGMYWQLLVGGCALLAWFVFAPHTLLSDGSFFFFLGSVLNLIFNANPLIKLDGYYFLSQCLQLPNLMDRSRGYWRGLLRGLLFGERKAEPVRYSRRERTIFFLFGFF